MNELKANGFKVYIVGDINKTTYFHFVKDNKIGYCQIEYFGGLAFSSCHIANIESGTGFRISFTNGGYTEGVYTDFLKWANETINTVKPNWFKGKAPLKYKSWEHYLSFERNQILTYTEVI
jgi:hypothetical protein